MAAPLTAGRTTKAAWHYDCVAIVLISVLPVLILRPFQNTPFIDDWSFAWSVQHLLQHGNLKVLEYSHMNVAQILWGALFCLPFGFSFSALRLSTWVASVVCLLGVYFTLREFNVSRRDSLIGVGVLAVYPIYFILSFTFMTDIPCLAAMVWSCLALVRALRLHSDRWLLASIAYASLATAVRIVAAVLPLVTVLTLLFQSDGWGHRKVRLLVSVAPLVVLCTLIWWHSRHVEYSADLSDVGNSPANRIHDLKEAIPSLPKMLPVSVTFVVCALGIALLPLIGGCLQRRHVTRAIAICGVVGAAVIIQAATRVSFSWPLEPGSTWELYRLGETDSLVPDYNDVDWPPSAAWGVPIMSIVLGAMAVALVSRVHYRRFEPVLAFLILGEFLVVATLWLFYDRYALVFIPSSIALVLSGNRIVRPLLAFSLIAIFACICFVGVRDHLEYNRSLWAAVDYLHRRGVKDSMIDAGYVVDGWQQYAHPENAPRGKDGKIYVPGFTTFKQSLRYRVSNSSLPKWKLLETFSYRRWLGPSGAIYVLECAGGNGSCEFTTRQRQDE